MAVPSSLAYNADKPEKKPTVAASRSMASNADEPEDQAAQTRSISSFFHIALAFGTVFLPLVLVATLLCLFVTLPLWTIYDQPEENANLPITPLDSSVFLTTVYSNKVILTSSFASNIAQFAATPFLLLFSFLVALALANRHEANDEDTTKLLDGDQNPMSVLLRLWRVRNNRRANGTRIAGVGALISIILTVLLMAGDKILQGTIGETSSRIYSSNFKDPVSNGTFTIDDTRCTRQETIPDIYDDKAAPPCSIDNTTDPWTLNGASSAYRVLAAGLLNQTSDYYKQNFDALWSSSNAGIFDWIQLVTHIDLVTNDSHVLLFDPLWAQEDSGKQDESKLDVVNYNYDRWGLDYIANTTSMVTKCVPITKDCGMRNITGKNNASIPYHCSDVFNGDLSQIPTNGLEQLKGWNTSFYHTEGDGIPQNISMASQLNPFHYNVAAVVDSIGIQDLIDFTDPEALKGNIVGIGDERVAFAISCTSTVYNVTYALVNGSIYTFDKTLADPHIAAIIKAPLQAGFGSYSLFEKAAVSVLFSDVTVMDSMALAFSQTFLALASGVYTRAPILEQRLRADVRLTKMGKGPFYLLVVCMFLYAFVILVFTVVALNIFRRRDVREVQVRLMPKD